MADFKPAPREKNSLDNTKFNLTTQNEKGRRATLKIELINNNPRITIYTGDPDDQENNHGRIQAKLDAVIYMLMIDRLEDMARKGDGKKIYSVNNELERFKDKKPTGEWYTANTLKFGRDDDGQVWLSVIERNRPKLKFIITNPAYHVLKNADGSDLPVGEVSRLFTLAWCGVQRAIIGPCMNANYVPPKPRDDAGGQRSGNNNGKGGFNKGGWNRGGNNSGSNNGGGNSSGGSQKSDSYESEIDDELWA